MINKKIFLPTLIVLLIFFALSTQNARAYDMTAFLGNPKAGINNMLDALGFNKDETNEMVKNLNVSRKKKQAPQVSLDFSPGNPTEGEKVTAAAKPIYFLNDISRLYYTWYLKHNNNDGVKTHFDKTLEKTIDCDEDGNCDLNDDGDIDIEDWKIEAARIIASNDFDWEKADYSSTSKDDDGYKAYLGGDDQQGKDPEPEKHCYLHNFETGDDFNIPEDKCKHLFPNAPEKNNNDFETGDDSFNKDEEKFWRTDPQNPDTANTGETDEANVAGLGIEEFTWNYQNGDKIGVAVEGISMDPTQSPDASYKIMWATLKNETCDSVSDSLDETSDSLANLTNGTATVVSDPVVTTDPVTGNETTVEVTTETTTVVNLSDSTAEITTVATTTTTVRDSGDNIISGPTTTTTTSVQNIGSDADIDDFNECLEDNLISPTEGGESQKIDVLLSYFPTSPINDPTGENATEIVVNSSITNANDQNILKYAWQVYKSDVINPDSWGDPLLKSELPGIGQTTGAGLSSIKFKPQFKDPAPKFLKVKLSVTENSSADSEREGHSNVIIPLSLTSNKISVFSVAVSPILVLSLEQAERCAAGMDKAFCPIVQNEIVGMSVAKENYTNFAWTVNGNPIKAINYPSGGSCLSGECNKTTSDNTNIAFFPVLKEKGVKYDVSLTASNAAGEKITLTKNFEVVDPEIKIISSDTAACRPVLLGNYLDLDGTPWPDYSDKNFQAAPGSTISLIPILNNPFAQDLLWYIDGVALTPENMSYFGAAVSSSRALTFPAAKQLGEIYNISVRALYSQDNNTKKFLNLNEGVQMSEFSESTMSDSIEIQMASLAGVPGAQKSVPRKFLAAIFTGLPAYISFLFRIVLTVMLILAVFWITMSLNLGTREE
ncbi:MAG: hypothetical protein WC608_03605 [Parcubacteria group bacterium]